MIDTIGILSPYIDENLAKIIENQGKKFIKIDCNSGVIEFEFINNNLNGSYDSRISISVKREAWIKSLKDGIPILSKTKPYLYIECSIHKLLLGHNCYGGSSDFNLCIKYLIIFIQKSLDIKLPQYDSWRVKRVDSAECYLLETKKHCMHWFKTLSSVNFARRNTCTFGETGVYLSGSTTTLKFYHKGSEFKKHDKIRLNRYFKKDYLLNTIDKAEKIVRVEVEIHKKKLVSDFSDSKELLEKNEYFTSLGFNFSCDNLPFIELITSNYLNKVHDNQVFKFLKESDVGMETVRKSLDVRERIFNSFESSLAGNLFGFWYQMTTLGENLVKSKMQKRTFYKYRKLLIDNSVSWVDTDITRDESRVINFSPIRSSPRRMLDVDSIIIEKLKEVI